MTCSWCDKQISTFRAFQDSRYCCLEHRKLEREHLRKLAIERLRETALDRSNTTEKLAQSDPAAEKPDSIKPRKAPHVRSSNVGFIMYSAEKVS